MSAEKTIDWGKIELEYRAGMKTLRAIADAHGIAHGSITKRAKRDGWVRDLKARIRAKADELVSKAAASKAASVDTAASERQMVDDNAQLQVHVRLEHRADIRRHRTLATDLLAELEAQTQNRELFDQLAELLRAPDKNGVDRLNELYRKVLSLPGRIDSIKKLTDTLSTLIGLERVAFGIDDKATSVNPFDDVLNEVNGRMASNA